MARGTSTGFRTRFRLDAPHNLYLLEAMEAYAAMLGWQGESVASALWMRKAEDLRKAIERVFWDRERGLLATYADRKHTWHHAAGVQALALSLGVPGGKPGERLRARWLSDPSIVAMTLQVMGYACWAMQGADTVRQEQFMQYLRTLYGRMILSGATSLWEVIDNRDDGFAIAGSLCHGWSAVPIWLNMAYILGVRPMTPGFQRFAVEPHLCGLPGATGEVPTPTGSIRVTWERCRNTIWLDVKHPLRLEPPRVHIPGIQATIRLTVNGRRRRWPVSWAGGGE